jgi:hypothetical protein
VNGPGGKNDLSTLDGDYLDAWSSGDLPGTNRRVISTVISRTSTGLIGSAVYGNKYSVVDAECIGIGIVSPARIPGPEFGIP